MSNAVPLIPVVKACCVARRVACRVAFWQHNTLMFLDRPLDMPHLLRY